MANKNKSKSLQVCRQILNLNQKITLICCYKGKNFPKDFSSKDVLVILDHWPPKRLIQEVFQKIIRSISK